jgi:aspartyl-tRNA(Asn)/glutamyl-tRNA(Gln) amidotransferase subunit B
LPDVVSTGKSPGVLVKERGLAQVSDTTAIESAARQAIESNPAAVADYKSGKLTAINFLKGQVMKSMRGQANPSVAEDVLKRLLAS